VEDDTTHRKLEDEEKLFPPTKDETAKRISEYVNKKSGQALKQKRTQMQWKKHSKRLSIFLTM
jgi:hypothetical protein